MRKTTGILIVTGFLLLLMVYSGEARPPRGTRLYDLVTNPSEFDNKEVLVAGHVTELLFSDNSTVEIRISSNGGKYEILLILDPALLNTIPNQGDSIEAKGFFTISGVQPHVEVKLIHVRTTWGQYFIYIRSIVAIPVILYYLRQGWDLVRV